MNKAEGEVSVLILPDGEVRIPSSECDPDGGGTLRVHLLGGDDGRAAVAYAVVARYSKGVGADEDPASD